MGYMHIENLSKNPEILLFRRCYALEKIHGTSAHLSWRVNNGIPQLHYSSGGASSVNFQALFNDEELKAKFLEHIGHTPATVYGEAYGGKLLHMGETYGPNLKFVVFDIEINDLWLSVPNAETLTKSLGLEFVHYNEIDATPEAIDHEISLDSVQAVRNGMGSHIREGVVLRPLIELRKNNNERFISKHKRAEFRETHTARPIIPDPETTKKIMGADSVAFEWVTPMRLQHVLDKIPQTPENPLSMRRTLEVKDAMLEDVLREGAGEFEDTPEVRKAISKRAADLLKEYLNKN